jgi:hypothetical protein
MRAAVNLVIAVKDGKVPDNESLNVLADAFLDVFGGRNPKALFGSSIGLVHGRGRRPDYGFTASDIVSAVIEIERRRLNGARGALAAAKRLALESFVDISGDSASRSIERDWAAGKNTVESMTLDELNALVLPYKY